jgi:hypothetical protein
MYDIGGISLLSVKVTCVQVIIQVQIIQYHTVFSGCDSDCGSRSPPEVHLFQLNLGVPNENLNTVAFILHITVQRLAFYYLNYNWSRRFD